METGECYLVSLLTSERAILVVGKSVVYSSVQQYMYSSEYSAREEKKRKNVRWVLLREVPQAV